MTSRTALTIDSTCDITHAQVQQRRSPRVSSLCSGRVGEQTKMHSMLSHQNGEQAGVACFVSHTFDFRLPGFSVTSGELVLQPSANLGTSRGGGGRTCTPRRDHGARTRCPPWRTPSACLLPLPPQRRELRSDIRERHVSAHAHGPQGERERRRRARADSRTFCQEALFVEHGDGVEEEQARCVQVTERQAHGASSLAKKKNSKRNRW